MLVWTCKNYWFVLLPLLLSGLEIDGHLEDVDFPDALEDYFDNTESILGEFGIILKPLFSASNVGE